MRIIYIFVKFVRFIFNFPLLIIIKIGSTYSYLLKFLDIRNHDTFWEENLQKEADKKKSKKIFLDKKKFLRFYTPSLISAYRAKSFFTKEPDTLKWLDKNGSNKKILYDIGANVGIYSLYYSKRFNSTSYTFEPSFVNLNLIQNNLKLNNLEKKVVIIPNPLYSKTAISKLYQLRRVAGDAVTTFNDNKVFKNMLDRSNLRNSPTINQVLGLSIDSLIENRILKKPNLIKIDVDGNEIEVLKGCKKTLSDNRKISILIELRKDTYNYAKNFLETNGFKFVSKMRNNYIWEK